jgi:hypothetical protein
MRKVKHGERPGDVPRRVKIAMREGRHDELPHYVTDGEIATFRRYMKRKTVKIERQRGKSEAVHLLKSPANAARLMRYIKEANARR